MKPVKFLLLALVFPLFCGAGYIDVHMHLKGDPKRDGGQNQQPRGPQFRRGPQMQGRGGGKVTQDFEGAAQALLERMDRTGVQTSLIMPPPQTRGQKGSYTYDQMLSTLRKYPGRLVLAAGGGELNPILMATEPSDVTPQVRKQFGRQAMHILNDGAKAFGEMTALHFSFSQRHAFEQTDPDHPLFLQLANIAAKRGVPIDLHMEAVPEDQPTPPKLRQRSPNNPEIIKANIAGFERLLAHNRDAKIVWQHVGWDNTGHMTTDLVRRLLQTHSNLYCALKFVQKKYEPFQLGEGLMDENMQARPEWVQLISEFPDRFVVGADDFAITAGAKQKAGPPSFEDTWAFVSQLPAALREKVGRENAARIYGL